MKKITCNTLNLQYIDVQGDSLYFYRLTQLIFSTSLNNRKKFLDLRKYSYICSPKKQEQPLTGRYQMCVMLPQNLLRDGFD